MPGNRFHWNSYDDEALVCAFDMSTLTPGGLLKNLANTGSTYDATIVGAPTYVQPLIQPKRTKCSKLDGTGDFFQVADGPELNMVVNLSLIAWVNFSAFDAVVDGVVVKGNTTTSANSPYGLYVRQGKPEFMIGNGAGSFQFARSPTKIVTNESYLLVGVLDSTHLRIFVNGKQHAATPRTINPCVSAEVLLIGTVTNAPLYDINAYVDNVLIYNIGLLPEQIWSLYRSAHPR